MNISFKPGRGEVLGLDEGYMDTLLLRCAATLYGCFRLCADDYYVITSIIKVTFCDLRTGINMVEEENLRLPDEVVMEKIHFIRGKKVMLDRDLADLYGVTTGNLNKAVIRNIARFPDDFMFQLTKEEFDNLIFQIGRSSWGGLRKLPRAFSEQGVAMLSGVLNSARAINVNIHIMRVFSRMREMLTSHKDILKKLEELERKDIEQDDKIILILEYIKQLEKSRKDVKEFQERPRIGFKK
jgi:hypothetical protein